ncbi:ABC transporter ATP-binding protein [Bacillus sp. DX1.1]|uniref:ABC transporter ATP-binding protein n=1 Tax=unclassified Bacillus (in: firmicutes) TaxID=185979 RepID=UPI002570B17F|nr:MULTISPECIES: ABC transporter ATP-binding protein [unclassified Bacillus (in: firmicutes)]MDM5154438.1 ABC transporter ATP-binding protein [Bacillus sp. DX1.1]WJE83342.1 ABC transporter ATP-binding protein [Bacillus sp. DX3.1]
MLVNVEQNKPVIELGNLCKRYGEFVAVNEISLSVPKGEIFAFLGSNGAGKTTTMKMITGQLKPTSGYIHFFGHDIWKERGLRQQMGYVPDTPMLHDDLTAGEMLKFMGGLYGMNTNDVKDRTEELLARMDILDCINKQIKEFSLGMKRKVAVACALIHRPQILLLDEVTNGLDIKSTRDIKDHILKVAKKDGCTVFLTTHILEIVEELADRIAIIHKGNICELGTLEELQEKVELPGSKLEEVFLSVIS